MKFLDRCRLAVGVLRKSLPFNRLAELLSGSGNGKALTQPMRNSVWVQRAIRSVSGPITAVGIDFEVNDQPVEDSVLKQWFRHPARSQRGKLSLADTIEAITGLVKLEGECFLLLDDSLTAPFPMARGGLPPPVIIAGGGCMQPLEDRGQITGWSYRDGRGGSHLLLAEQVIQIANWNPYDEIHGLAEYAAAEIAAQADYAAGSYVRNLMRSNGDRGPYIGLKNGAMLSDEQRKQLLTQIKEKRELAARGDFRAMFVTADITIDDPKVQTIDSGFLAARLQNRHEIFLAFGVPPCFADVEQSYSMGASSAWYRLIIDTCQPMGGKIAAAFSVLAQRITGQPVTCSFDWDEHPVMQAVRAERVATAAALWNMGMPLNDASEYLDLGLPELPAGRTAYLPFSVAPAGTTAAAPDPADDPALGEDPPAGDAVTLMRSALALRGLAREHQHALGCGCQWAPEDILTRAGANATWRKQMASRRAAVARTRAWFTRNLLSARAQTLERIAARGNVLAAMGVTAKAAAADFIFDAREFRSALLASLRGVARASLLESGKQVLEEIGRPDDPWSVPDEKVLHFLATRENRISGISDAVWHATKESLDEGIRAGEGAEKLAGRIRETFGGLDKEKSLTIAITETGAAYGYGRQDSMVAAGVRLKKWVSSGLPNVRPTHIAADLAPAIPVEQAFTVGQAKLMHPGDPTGPAEEVINCHCVAVAVAE